MAPFPHMKNLVSWKSREVGYLKERGGHPNTIYLFKIGEGSSSKIGISILFLIVRRDF